ncbi:hypothetical protein P8817_04820 [Bacillus glycinifermentans]|nr:hypothetical protein [Bacillus glycinifermentans]MEC0539895.1 hypothetical protein [Bacillus glycinifermentans]
MSLEKKEYKEYDLDTDGMERENALIRVYDGGKIYSTWLLFR